MLQFKRLLRWVKHHWKPLTVIVIFSAVCVGLSLYKLGSLTGGVSDDELMQRAFAGNWHHIADNPLNAPLTVVQWLFITLFSHQGQTVIRLGSVALGLASIAAIAYILKRWYGTKTAFAGTLVFATSAWFLHVSRHASPDIIYLWAVPTLLAAQIFWERRHYSAKSSFLLAIVVAILLYIPGMFWIVLVSFGLQTAQVAAGWKQLRNWQLRSSLSTIILLLVLPLIIAICKDSSLWLTWLGFPTHVVPTNIPRNLVHAISFFVWRGPAQPTLWLDRLPILTVFSIVMFIIGAIFYTRHASAVRSRLLLGIFIVGAGFSALQGPVAFSILVPIVYIVIAAGIGYFLHEWLKVFPRNPLARSVSYSLLGILILLVVSYNTRSYFIAWPHNSLTRAAFHNRL